MKKNSDNNISTKRFTILDLLICLVVLSLVVYFGMRFFMSDNSHKGYNVTYSVVITMPDEQVNNFSNGDKVLTSDGEKVIGEIVNVTKEKATDKYYTISDNTSSVIIYSESEKDFKDYSQFSEESNIFTSSDDLSEADFSSIAEPDVSNNESEDPYSSEDDIVSVEPTVEKNVIQIPGYSFVTITISANLNTEQGSYYINGQTLKIDSEVEVTTNKFSATGKCIKISNFASEKQEN